MSFEHQAFLFGIALAVVIFIGVAIAAFNKSRHLTGDRPTTPISELFIDF